MMHFNKKPLAGALACLLLYPATTWANTTPSTDLGTLEVAADRFGVITIQAANPNQIEKVSHSAVPMRNATLVNEFLNEVPGVNIGGTSALDQHIYIRGVDDKSLKITVDGARQENYFFHHAGSLALDPMFYKAAEIAVGNNSVTLGNNAKGGGIAFTTVDASDLLEADKKVGATLKLGYANNDQQFSKMLSVYGKPSAHSDLLLAYGHRSADGGEDARSQPIRGDELTTQNILAKLTISPHAHHKISLGYKQLKNEGRYPFRPEWGYSGASNRNQINPGHNNSDEYTLNYQYSPSDKVHAQFNAYHTEREYLTQGSRQGRMIAIDYKGEVNGVTAKIRNRLSHTLSNQPINHQITYGAEVYEKSTTATSAATPTQKSTSYGVYLEDQVGLGRFTLTPGVRYDLYKAGRLYGDERFKKFSGALATNIKLTKNVDLFFGYTQFFNGPPSPEAIHNGSAPWINPELKPETGNNSEYGITANFLDVFEAGDGVRLSAKAFRSNLKDTIVTKSPVDCLTGAPTTNNNACRTYINSGDSKIDGYELSARYAANALSLSASYEHAKSTHSQAGTSGRVIPKDVGDRFSMTATHHAPNYEISLRYNHIAGVNRNDIHYVGYQTFDIYGSYQPSFLKNLSFDAGMYNATNKWYVSHSSQKNANNQDADMGRNIKISATYKF